MRFFIVCRIRHLNVICLLGCFVGGLIQLNHGRPQPLQYVVNAAFLAALYSDYLDAADTPGWYCGPNFYSTDVLRKFAKTQVLIVFLPSITSYVTTSL